MEISGRYVENERPDEYWMSKAIECAREATDEGELPIAAILVAGNKEVARAQTQVKRKNSIVAHAELMALLQAGEKVFTEPRPLVMFTTIEPCLMCIGAAMQCQVDKIVYAMPSGPDGGTRFVGAISEGAQKPPEIIGGVLKDEATDLVRRFVRDNPKHFAIDYVEAILQSIDKAGA